MTIGSTTVDEAKGLICDLCRLFYDQGWVGGTGGGISMKALAQDGSERIVMAPSGVQKERMEPRDMFVLDNQGNVLHTPEARPPPYRPPKLSECQPLFTAVGDSSNSAVVKHSKLPHDILSLPGALFRRRMS
jgi:methylthioribulose 1-phosphate dehydratase/enolase-phosphatase E1